jgi:L-lysine exporter family protein LysE/ArgO
MIEAALTGYFTSFSLILAIGAQNAFVLRQGLLRQHIFTLCLMVSLSDAVLIGVGVAGAGKISQIAPWFTTAMALFGAAFLLVYGALRFKAAWQGGEHLTANNGGAALWRTLSTAAALTWLNPHVYLDTVALIGAISVPFEGAEKWAFGISAALASFTFFFALGYGARLLAPALASPRAWRRLDIAIGLVMWALALGLLIDAL